MKESGQIEYDADVILATYRPARELELDLRAMANDDRPDQDFWDKTEELNKVKHKLELLTLKARQGEEGMDRLHVQLGYDTINEPLGSAPANGGR
jgi:replicative DNA helicase